MSTPTKQISDKRLLWWDRSIWWRTYRQGGYDGFRTITGRRLPCATMDTALRRPELRSDIRLLAARRRRRDAW
ncbi:hypothetical protein [Pseudonocardia sp.]|uniref:hypothetical protein n=1 Tax=Pseudonocardia sp. TaxID=60912 RepID=UPI002619A71D|nr:hypothetical protein [Pseudonocardia sp.]MCW2720704.1 hypothetical protein [Pseudonocardia sp.]